MPERIEDYEVLGLIGTGSFGTCYKVRKKNTNHVFVWKAIDYGSMTEERKKLLVSEVNLLRELKHPNIVRYYDRIIHKESATIYIIMELCEGGDLATLIHKCQRTNSYVDETFVWRVLYQSSRALQACHGPGRPVLHRDIKPANLFLDSEFNVKLGDFGLARVLTPSAENDEYLDDLYAETVVGTPFYMSPEVVKGNKYNRKSDVWSLGCVIYELCSLSPPFASQSIRALAQRIKDGRFARIPAHYSDELHQIIVFMLTVDHDIRPNIQSILHHPSVVSHVAQWSIANPLYRKVNPIQKNAPRSNKNDELLDETFCSCPDDCCARGVNNAQIGGSTKGNQLTTDSRSDHTYRTSTLRSSKIKSVRESEVVAEIDKISHKISACEKDIPSNIIEQMNLLRQKEAKLRMKELTLEERERVLKKKEREAALASRLARETMGRACVYLKNCRDSRGSISSATAKLTLRSRSPSERTSSIPNADSSLDQEQGETSTIETTSARLDPRSIGQPFWNGSNTLPRKVTFSLRNLHCHDAYDSASVNNARNSAILTMKNITEAKNLVSGLASERQSWLEAKRQAYRENADILDKENQVPITQNKQTQRSTKKIPHLENSRKNLR